MNTGPCRLLPGRTADGTPVDPLSGRRVYSWPVGDRMRNLRVDAELTQKAVARRLYVSPRTVREWESGRRRLSVEQLEAYLHVVGGTITLGGPA